MPRITRWAFRVAAALWLLFCIATVVMWISSESAYETLFSISSENPPIKTVRANALIFDNGRLWISRDVVTTDTVTNVNRIRFGREPKIHGSIDNVHTFWFYRGPWGPTGTRTALVVRLWIVTLLLGWPPAIWLYRGWRKRRKLKPGHCPTCGYDLRATPDRCPECGTPIPTSTTPAG